MALHIEHFKDFPVYFYSQGVIGALEAYIGAMLFSVFGPTAFALRLGVLLLFIPFLVGMYLLTSLLYNKGLALLTLVLLSLGSSEILLREYAAFAGHGETPLFGALIVLVATWLALSSPIIEQSARWPWRRMLAYAVWGWLVGVAFWNDPLALPFILTSSIFLLLFCRHELRYPVVLSILIALFIGLLPTIIYSVNVPIGRGSLSVFGYLVSYAHPVPSDSLFERLAAAFLVTLPVSTGAGMLCPMTLETAWPITAQMVPCTTIHGVWAFALVLAWLSASIMAVRALRPLWRRFPEDETFLEKRRTAIIQGARLVLLISALMAFLVFAVSVQSITGPWYNNRYLIALGVATPAVLWPLWQAFGTINFQRRSATLLAKIVCVVVLGCYIITLSLGTWQTTKLFPNAGHYMQWRENLASSLLRLHIKDIYTDYWTCDVTAFLSLEQVKCSVLDPQLRTGVNRYEPYVSTVAQDSQAAYVFQVDSEQAKVLAIRMIQKNSDFSYRVMYVDGYVIYQPVNKRFNQ